MIRGIQTRSALRVHRVVSVRCLAARAMLKLLGRDYRIAIFRRRAKALSSGRSASANGQIYSLPKLPVLFRPKCLRADAVGRIAGCLRLAFGQWTARTPFGLLSVTAGYCEFFGIPSCPWNKLDFTDEHRSILTSHRVVIILMCNARNSKLLGTAVTGCLR